MLFFYIFVNKFELFIIYEYTQHTQIYGQFSFVDLVIYIDNIHR